MKTKLTGRFWLCITIFSLMGQIAWVVENMYFNVFIYKMFNASAEAISAMVAASAVAATVTTLLIGAFSDKIGGSILQQAEIKKADEAGKKTILKLFKGYYKHPEKLPDACVFAFLGACHALEPGADRDKYERDLQENAAKNGMDPLRTAFAEKFRKRSKTTEVEELVLMRTICNHIASMTDADARRAARQFCK